MESCHSETSRVETDFGRWFVQLFLQIEEESTELKRETISNRYEKLFQIDII